MFVTNIILDKIFMIFWIIINYFAQHMIIMKKFVNIKNIFNWSTEQCSCCRPGNNDNNNNNNNNNNTI